MSKKMKIKPLGNRILVKRLEAESKQGKILLPSSAQEKPKEGIVEAIGAGNMKKDGSPLPMEVKVGDRVLFSDYAGTEVEREGTSGYLVLSEEDVLAIMGESK